VRKKPVLSGWKDLATTDPRRIHSEYNSRALPEYDGILMPTGTRSGRWVLDVDGPEDLERLEEQLGVVLRGISTEVRTQSGNLQIHFLLDPRAGEVSVIPNSVGKKLSDGFELLDVRGEGGQVLLPPSAGYSFANDLPTAEAPSRLVEWAVGRKRKKGGSYGTSSNSKSTQRSSQVGDGPILSGARHDTLASILGGKHDGSRSLDELIALALEINVTRCVPPIGAPGDEDDVSDVEKIARWVFFQPPCQPTNGPEQERGDQLLEEAGRYWSERVLSKGGRGKLCDVFRACLVSASRKRVVRTVQLENGEEGRGCYAEHVLFLC
jgi:hypothetical protein